MSPKTIEECILRFPASGVVHRVPEDLREILIADKTALEIWEDITPLARNEWICWVEDAKRQKTRSNRIQRVRAELKEGKRRPCCWPGCPHRLKMAVSVTDTKTRRIISQDTETPQ